MTEKATKSGYVAVKVIQPVYSPTVSPLLPQEKKRNKITQIVFLCCVLLGITCVILGMVFLLVDFNSGSGHGATTMTLEGDFNNISRSGIDEGFIFVDEDFDDNSRLRNGTESPFPEEDFKSNSIYTYSGLVKGTNSTLSTSDSIDDNSGLRNSTVSLFPDAEFTEEDIDLDSGSGYSSGD